LPACAPEFETVLLIDEIDRSDHEFEAFLLEFLSDFQISIPSAAPFARHERPVVILTSNRTRDLHEALRRRCVYHWIDYPDCPEREMRIIMMRASSVGERDGARGRRRGRTTAPRAARQASRHRRSGRMGGGRDAYSTSRARAGRTPLSVRSASSSRTRTISSMWRRKIDAILAEAQA
jgi:MoxR-like ATPase